MDFDTKVAGNATVVSIGGRVDATTAPELADKLTALINGGSVKLVLNVEKLAYISSAGLRVFLTVAKTINSKSGKLVLSGLQGAVKQVFEISGLFPIFTVTATEADAVKQF